MGGYHGDICPFCSGKIIGEEIEKSQYLDDSVKIEEIKKKIREKIIEQGKYCYKCKKVENIDFKFQDKPHLREYKDNRYCDQCLKVKCLNDNPNPSTETKIYEFNFDHLNWVLTKVLVPCSSCGEKRWLTPENQWKKMCLTCYKLHKGW